MVWYITQFNIMPATMSIPLFSSVSSGAAYGRFLSWIQWLMYARSCYRRRVILSSFITLQKGTDHGPADVHAWDDAFSERCFRSDGFQLPEHEVIEVSRL